MSDPKITLSWMWRDGESINALKINTDRRRLEWFDEIGCACGDSTAEQSFADFAAHGAKLSGVPDDVLSELRQSLNALESSES